MTTITTRLTCHLLFYITLQIVNCLNKEEGPVVAEVRHIGLPTKGKYLVREEVEKAPTYDHPCQLTETAVKISFPEEMRSEIFVNLLGYKEPNLLHLQRCKGQCSSQDSLVTCRATKVKENKVKMLMRSALTGKEPVDRVKELILDEHTECGCECSPELAAVCAGRFNAGTCDCECPSWEFAELRALCELRKDSVWDSRRCQCSSRGVEARGAERDSQGSSGSANYQQPCYGAADRRHYQLLDSLDQSQTAYRALDMIGWVIFGSLLTLVAAFALSTFHYRKRARRAENKSQSGPAPLDSVFSHSKCVYQAAGGPERSDNLKKKSKTRTEERKYKYRPGSRRAEEENFAKSDGVSDFPQYLIGAGAGVLEQAEEDHQYFPSEEGACGDRYDRHGVKIEENIDSFI